MRDSILFSSRFDDPDPWRTATRDNFPHLDFRIWPDCGPLDRVRYALIWTIDDGLLRQLPNLRAVLALGAGVDQFLADPAFPSNIPLARLKDAGMGEQMAQYCLFGVLHHHRHMGAYRAFQTKKEWSRLPARAAADQTVAVLGLGQLGGQVAQAIAAHGFHVLGWSRTKKEPAQHPGIRCVHGDEGLRMVQRSANVIINMLPLTPATRGFLNCDFFTLLNNKCFLINVARGAHVIEADLCNALDGGNISGALLDVFHTEPLPQDSPLWTHPNVTITPHIAAQTLDKPAMDQILENLRRLENNEPMVGVVDPKTGY